MFFAVQHRSTSMISNEQNHNQNREREILLYYCEGES